MIFLLILQPMASELAPVESGNGYTTSMLMHPLAGTLVLDIL